MPSEPVALAIADLHIWGKPPLIRTAEEDWLRAMQYQFDQVKKLQAELSGGRGKPPLPILCAGDVFDRHNPDPEVLNWCLDHLPHMLAIWGQHDVRHHRAENLDKSGFMTLVKASRITPLMPGKPVAVGKIRAHGFGWGEEIIPCVGQHGLALEVAVAHRYVWSERKEWSRYPGAPDDGEIGSLQQQLAGYDVAVFGDNHQSWKIDRKSPRGMSVYNCGTFLRRKLDEIDHRPAVGIIYFDGTVKRHYLDVSQDRFLDSEMSESMKNASEGLNLFLSALSNLGSCGLDYLDAIREMMDRERVSPSVRELMAKLLEET